MNKQDDHFLIDNASPIEIAYTLRCLDPDIAYSTADLRARIMGDWGYEVQRNFTNSTRRLFDLGLAAPKKTSARKPGYVVTPLGLKVRSLADLDHGLYKEAMHFLHFDGWDNCPTTRKLFWSYRKCCEFVWNKRVIPPTQDIVTYIQDKIAEDYSELFAQRKGGNFNAGGVNSGWKPWIADLEPPVLGTDGQIMPRAMDRFEPTVLALDNVYRMNGYHYGDPVLLDDVLLDQIAQVFFLDVTRCRELIGLAARLTRVIKLSDTFTGTSVTLLEPYTIERI